MCKKLIGVGISENKEHLPHSAQGQCEGSSQRLHLPLSVWVAAQNSQTMPRTGTIHGHEQKKPLLQLSLTSPHKAEMQKGAAPDLLPHCLLQFSPNLCLSACVSLQSELSPGQSKELTPNSSF